jgi:hypothetical protein
MGRPLKKDINGTNVIGTFGGTVAGAGVDSRAGIRVTGKFGGNTNNDYYIVKQRGARTYLVTRDGTTLQTGVLVESIVNDGDILIMGSTDGTNTTGNNISIQKLTRRLAVDFYGNYYTWFLTQYEDSSGDWIKLTPLS